MKRLCFVLLLVAASGQVAAQEAKEVWEEYSKRTESSGKVSPLGPNLFGDQVSLSNGALSFSVTDTSLPGNHGLPVALTRNFSVRDRTGYYSDSPMADWDIDLPSISGVFAPDWVSATAATPLNRCSAAPTPPTVSINNSYFYPVDYWNGITLNIPGVGGGELLRTASSAPKPSTGGPYVWVTNDLTQVSCLSSIKNGAGEGFLATTADGTRYWFDWMAQFMEPVLEGTGNQDRIGRRKNVLYATRVEDRFGNRVDYTYSNAAGAPGRPTKIAASDGRQITLAYNSYGHVASINNGTQTWQYQYAAAALGNRTLTAVIQPDNSRWAINFSALSTARIQHFKPVGGGDGPWRTCVRQPALVGQTEFTGAVTHPSGAVGQFTVKAQLHGQTNVPVNCNNFTRPHNDVTDDLSFWTISSNSFSLTKKTISGPGVTAATWDYAYSSPASYYYPSGSATNPICPVGTNCSIPRCTSDDCAGTSKTTVTGPGGEWTRYSHGNSFRYNEGKLISVESGTGPSSILRTVVNSYDMTSAFKFGTSPQQRGDGFSSEFVRPQRSTTTTQQGVTFSNTVDTLDSWARPLTVTKSSSLGYARTEKTAYYDNLNKWVVGQLASVTKTAPSPTQVMSSATYHATSALPVKFYSFGKLVQSLGYNADGTVATVKDGNNNTTTLSSWYRGIPRTVKYADGKTQAALVNANGWITRVTDENGYATNYTYDLMGRLASIAYPTADTTGWNTTTQTFAQVNSSEYGIPAGHWRQTISTGSARKIAYFDALWRPLVTREYDTGNVNATQRFTRQAFDHEGRVTFASYPSSTNNPSAGVRTIYDVLGRTTRSTQDSELGPLITSTAYLNGFQTRTTNPRGQQTQFRYQAYDQPTTQMAERIIQPEGAYTYIVRDAFGKPTRITRSDASNAVEVGRHYVYDGYQQLCKRVEPETGATVMAYDAAGNMAWSAGGQTFLSTTACDTASVPAAARTVRSYDARNRLKTLNFPDGDGSQSWSYTADGLPSQVTTYNDGGLTTVTNAYTYNKRRLLTGESLSQSGLYSWGVGYGYDANGHLANHTYPKNLSINYAPNALGQPTKAGAYATGVSYFPNGAMKQFTYGNGIVHTLAQNARGLPDRSRDAYGSVAIHDDGIDYDANGNVMAITDGARAERGNRNMSYDGLDRLKSTASPMFSTATYTYDVLDNLKTVKIAGRNHTYSYDARQRLTNVMNTVGGATVIGLGYDSRGNLANKNGVAYRFDLGNRLREVVGKEWYRYDAHGRRVEATHGSAGSIFSMYGNDGVLRYQEDYRKHQATNYVHLNGSLVAEVVSAAAVQAAPSLTVPSSSSSGTYSVSWSSVAGAKTYRLEQSVNSGAWTEVTERTTLSWTASGLSNGTYRYRVRSCAMGCSAYSAIKTATVGLIPKGIPSVTAPAYVPGSSYTVSWTGVTLATKYELAERVNSGSWTQIYNGSGGSKAISGKSSNTYSYRVRACNNHGCAGWSSVKAVSVELPPATAPGLTVPGNGLSGAYTITWGAVGGATSYTLEESADGGGWTTAYTGAARSKAYSGRPAGSYAYRVKACNPAGCSARSASKTVQVIYKPGAPTTTAPATNTTGAYTVSWTAIGTASSYQLQERPAGGSFATIHNAAGTSKSLSAKVTGSYEYRTRACNVAGCSGYSTVKTVQVTRPPTAAPALTAPATNTTGAYTISWTAIAHATKYQLRERPADGSFATIHNAAGRSKAVSGKATGTYEYQVRACNAVGCSAFTAVKAVRVTRAPTAAPTLSVPASSTTGNFTVSWTAVSTASRYELHERVASGSWSEIHDGAARSKAISGKAYKTWQYRVRACNAGGCGALSATKSISVAPPPPPVPTGLTMTNTGYCRALWNASSGATKYDLKISHGAIIYSGSGRSFTDDRGCSPWYAVRACNAHTCSAWSSPAYPQGSGGGGPGGPINPLSAPGSVEPMASGEGE